MKRLSIEQSIAVAVALSLVAFFLYGGTIMGLFNQTQAQTTVDNQTASGVAVTDIAVGNGAVAGPGDTVSVHYVGTLPDGKVFDSSLDRGQPFTFLLGAGQVIRGWDEGVAGMKVGGKRKLVISPDYGYGSRAVGPIPANSTLIFTVDLLNVTKGSK
ncbi:FKBP-type peptidyl-prolyl cis-trans isomerase [Candidatus Parcubacteria bacterium]|nr:FKBP-type peptidyl-prolyl cis-trans isomerase [Candidatus Parcubacteria bacterium]